MVIQSFIPSTFVCVFLLNGSVPRLNAYAKYYLYIFVNASELRIGASFQVAEEGTHEELLSTKGSVYSALVKRQLDIGDCRGMEDFGASTVPPNDFETDT